MNNKERILLDIEKLEKEKSNFEDLLENGWDNFDCGLEDYYSDQIAILNDKISNLELALSIIEATQK